MAQHQPRYLLPTVCAHEAMVFLEEASAVPAERRFTGLNLYSIGYKELLSKALPGDTVKQAPRMYTTMVAGLEENVMDPRASVYSRIYAWWVLVQTWCTLRFSDHRGISPQEVKMDSSGFAAVLRRSKTIGADNSSGITFFQFQQQVSAVARGSN